MRKFYIDGLGPRPHVSIGSQALVNATVEIIERRFGGSEYYFLSACPEVETEYLKQTGCRCRIVQRPNGLLGTYLQIRDITRQVDAVVCPWGDAYISSGPHLAFRKVATFRRRSLPRMLMTSSVGPFEGGWRGWMAKAAMRQFDVLTVRDSVTYDLFKSVGLAKVQLLPDTAFVLKAAGPARVKEILEAESIPVGPGFYVGVNASVLLFNRMQQLGADYIQLMVNLIRRVKSLTGLPVVLIPHQIYTKRMLDHYPRKRDRLLEADGDDREVLDLIYERLADSREVYAIRGEYSCSDYKGLISGCELFVGGRMHAVIAALSCGVCSLILEYSHKSRGLMEMLSLEDYVWPIEDSPERLWEKLSVLYDRRDAYRKRLLEIMPGLVEDAYSAGAALERTMRGEDP